MKTNKSVKSVTLGFHVEVKIPVNKGIVVNPDGIEYPAQAIKVGGIIQYAIKDNTISGTLYMAGLWRQAFGLKWLAIGDILLG